MCKVKLVAITPRATDLIAFACSKPYGKSISDKALDNIIKSGHLSVLEHATASFEIKCSQRVLGQITRHRHLSFTCKSARGSQFTHWVDPKTLEAVEMDREYQCRAYNSVKDLLSEEEAAYSLPQGVETEFVVTGNFRAWFEYLPKRLCKRAMPEHRIIAEAIRAILASHCPLVFNRNFMNCNNCNERSCSFK